MKVAVLGGGITGVTLTDLLVAQGHDVTCFEAAPRTGGLCQSETIDGFVVDRAGGHIIFSKDREVLDYVLGAVSGIGYHTSERNTHIHWRGREVQYPFENGLGDLPKESTFLCLRDYVNAWLARQQGSPRPEDFKEWCRWRFGEAICTHFMWPYNEKIWNVDLSEMGIEWVAGRVPDAPLDDVIKSSLGVRTVGYGHQRVFHYPLTGGFESIVDGILARLPEGTVRTASPVRSLERVGDGWSVDGRRFDRVISTIPLQELARVLQDVPAPIAKAFAGLSSTSLATVFLALAGDDVPPHSWVYFPHPENGPQNRITYLSNYSPENAPSGHSSIMAEVTYIGAPPGSDEEITREVISGLERCGVVEARRVLFTRVFHNRYAYILYRRDLTACTEAVRAHCAAIGLDLCGRFGNFDYFNSDACVRAAMDLAGRYADLARTGDLPPAR